MTHTTLTLASLMITIAICALVYLNTIKLEHGYTQEQRDNLTRLMENVR
jgi:hypothetical protein